MADVILAVLIFAPFVLTLVLRSNAALAYLTLCASFVLVTFGNADLKNLTGHLDLRVDSSTLNLILLMLPMLLTLLLTRRAFSKKLVSIKPLLHLITSLSAGGLLALVSVPLLNASARADFGDNWGWINLQRVQTIIIASGFVLSLLLIWLGHTKYSRHHK